VVFGAIEGDYLSPPFSNVALVIDAAGDVLGSFPKQRPVPLMLDGVPGNRRPVFPLDQGVLGVAICYDFDAPEVAGRLVRHGATVLVAPTMDAIEWTETQHDHHELLCRLRAVDGGS
jgi:predicted amidohydrolase